MDKAKVVVFEKANEPLKVKEFTIPEVEEGCILVKPWSRESAVLTPIAGEARFRCLFR